MASPACQKAVRVHEFSLADPAGALSVADDAPVPKPGQGQVLVRVTLRPVNPADVFSVMGVYPGFVPEAMPAVPGLEGVGVVAENGPGASKFQPGQRVVGCPFDGISAGSGTWQQYIVVGEDCLLPVPEGLSDEAASQYWVNPITVYGMVAEVLAVPEGEWLLQTAAGSVLGRQIIQLAKHRGVKTINVVRRPDLVDELKALGADEVIVSADGAGLADAVKALTGGRGAYGAVECIGGDIFAAVVSAVRPGGTAIIYGAMSGLSASFSIPDPLFRDVTIRGFWLMPWTDGLGAAEKRRVCETVLRLLADGIMTPYAGQRFPLERAADAMKQSQANARGGKVLLEG